jgi:hypothetical protein
MSSEYPDKDYPFNFYFNGEQLPKWGACWSLAQLPDFLNSKVDSFHREVWAVYCQIDHVGVVESADADFFTCALQEVLHVFLGQRDSVLAKLKDQAYGSPEEIYRGLVEAAFQMRKLTTTRKHALWTSGYEADQKSLVETIRRCHLPATSPEFIQLPHLRHLKMEIQLRHDSQIRELHQLAQSGKLDKLHRKKLYQLQ